MKNEEQETTQTIDRDDVFEALRDIGEKTTIRGLGIALGVEDLLPLSNLVKRMAADGELRYEFNSDDIREYWINDEIEESTPESTETNPTEELPLSDRILTAIDNHHGTLAQIKRFIGVPVSTDISEAMDELEHSHVIERDYNGEVTGFFRQGQIPAKWWITGEGTIGVEVVEPDPEAPHPFADRIGREEVPPRNAIDLQSPIKQSRLIDVTASDVEEAFAEAGTVEASAEILKMSRSTLEAKLQAWPVLKDAAKRGRAMFYEMNPDKRPSKSQAPVEEKAMETTIEETKQTTSGIGHSLDITAEKVFEAASTYATRREIGLALGYTGLHTDVAVGNLLRRRPEFVAEFERGLARYKADHADQLETEKPRTNRRERIILTPEQVEEAAAEFKTQLKTAKALGFNVVNGAAAFRDRLRNHADLAAAFERGVARFNANKTGALAETVPETTPEPSDGLPTPETHTTESAEPEARILPESEAVEIRDEIENEDSLQTQDELEPVFPCHNCKFEYKTVAEAVKCFEQHERHSERVEAESLVKPTSIEMEIEESDIKRETANATAEFVTGLMEERRINGRPLLPSDIRMEAVVQGFRPSSASVNQTYITLQNGSQLLVTFEGNFLELSDRDREVVIHVSRLMQQYEDGRLTVAGHDDKPRKLGQRVKDVVWALFG